MSTEWAQVSRFWTATQGAITQGEPADEGSGDPPPSRRRGTMADEAAGLTAPGRLW
jgi:hypothetical protein